MACLVMTIARLRVLKYEEKMQSLVKIQSVNTIVILILIIMDMALKI